MRFSGRPYHESNFPPIPLEYQASPFNLPSIKKNNQLIFPIDILYWKSFLYYSRHVIDSLEICSIIQTFFLYSEFRKVNVFCEKDRVPMCTEIFAWIWGGLLRILGIWLFDSIYWEERFLGILLNTWIIYSIIKFHRIPHTYFHVRTRKILWRNETNTINKKRLKHRKKEST